MSRKCQVVFHIGLPKTGTKALQTWCFESRNRLREFGIEYPDLNAESWMPRRHLEPLHQFVVNELRSGVFCKLPKVLAAGERKTILFSTEALSNQFYDFTQGQLSAFRSLLAHCGVTLFIVTRSLESWRKSYYKQCVVNPPMPGYPYATALDFEEFVKLPRVSFLESLPANPRLLASAFGAEDVVVAHYEEDWFKAFLRTIDAEPDGAALRINEDNVSLDETAVSLVVEINRLELGESVRSSILGLLDSCLNSRSNIMRYLYRRQPAVLENREQINQALDRLAAGGQAYAGLIQSIRTELDRLLRDRAGKGCESN